MKPNLPARAAGAAYADAHRVRGQTAGRTPGNRPGTQSGDPFAKACPPLVSWYPTRVQACSAVTAYALSLREWALGLDGAE
jgi:hypothetical protein